MARRRPRPSRRVRRIANDDESDRHFCAWTTTPVQAKAYWWVTALSGFAVLGLSVAKVVPLEASAQMQILLGVVLRGADRPVSGSHPRREDVRLGRGDLHLPAAARLRTGGGGDRGRRRGGHHFLAHLESLDEPPRQPGNGGAGDARLRERLRRRALASAARVQRMSGLLFALLLSDVARLFRGRHVADGFAHQAEARRTRATDARFSASTAGSPSGTREARRSPACCTRPSAGSRSR